VLSTTLGKLAEIILRNHPEKMREFNQDFSIFQSPSPFFFFFVPLCTILLLGYIMCSTSNSDRQVFLGGKDIPEGEVCVP